MTRRPATYRIDPLARLLLALVISWLAGCGGVEEVPPPTVDPASARSLPAGEIVGVGSEARGKPFDHAFDHGVALGRFH